MPLLGLRDLQHWTKASSCVRTCTSSKPRSAAAVLATIITSSIFGECAASGCWPRDSVLIPVPCGGSEVPGILALQRPKDSRDWEPVEYGLSGAVCRCKD
jgi:hypothetical protein